MIAFCGLDCLQCEAYLATREDSDNQRYDVAKKWSALYHKDIKPGQINCDGCKSNGRLFFHCKNTCGIRKCCKSKGVDNCAVCSDYACAIIAEFTTLAPEAGKTLEKLRQ